MNLKNTLALTLLFIGMTTVASAQQKQPASPPETVQGTINGANITINYSAPSVKGREIWGGLVPFDKVWRAGANNATTFTTDKAIVVEGKSLPAGTYAFFVIPTKSEATVIFNKVASQWGAYDYDAAQDQLRIHVKPKLTDKRTEKLLYTIDNGAVVLSWDNWNIPISVK